MAVETPAQPVQRYRWTRDQFERVVGAGGFGADERVELLDGELWSMTPHGSRHAAACAAVAEAARAAFGAGFHVRSQSPVALDESSEPQPDLTVVPGRPFDYAEGHPSRPLLAVEVSESSLAFDRGRKMAAYARNGITDYWIVNLTAGTVEVHRDPAGDTYSSTAAYRKGDEVKPLHAPGETTIRVADLLP